MRSLVIGVGGVLLVVACTRENGAFDGAGADGSAGEEVTTRTDGADGPLPSTGSATGSGSGSGLDGTATGDPPSTSGSTSMATTMHLEGTTMGNDSAEGPTSSGATTDAPGTTTSDAPPESCCDPFMPCENNEVSGCACAIDAECCNPSWGLYCVALAMSEDCLGLCPLPDPGCCDGSGVPGCSNPDLMACVCATNPECCLISWDGGCASLAAECPKSPCL